MWQEGRWEEISHFNQVGSDSMGGEGKRMKRKRKKRKERKEKKENERQGKKEKGK